MHYKELGIFPEGRFLSNDQDFPWNSAPLSISSPLHVLFSDRGKPVGTSDLRVVKQLPNNGSKAVSSESRDCLVVIQEQSQPNMSEGTPGLEGPLSP